jgi:DNA-binding transcriptional LysR family regulator
MLQELRSRGTITAVAQALSLTPSGVSQQLSQLQQDVGVVLVEQAGRRARLTAAGELLADHAESLLARVELAQNEVAEHANVVGGTLRVLAFPTAIRHLLAPCLPALAEHHPGLRVEVEDDESDAVLTRLALGEADLVLADEYEHLPRPRDSRLSHQVLLVDPVRLAIPRDDPRVVGPGPLLLADMASSIWACGKLRTSHAAMVSQVCNTVGGFDPDIRYRSNDLTVLLALVGSGRAVALLPDLVRAADDPSVVIRDLGDAHVARLILAWSRKSSSGRPAERVVMAALRTTAELRGHRQCCDRRAAIGGLHDDH